MNSLKTLTKIIFSIIFVKLYGQNLILDNQSPSMTGTHNYDVISLNNGSFINVVGDDKIPLSIICIGIFIDANSGIIASGTSEHGWIGDGGNFASYSGGGGGGGLANTGGAGGGLDPSAGGDSGGVES